MTQSPNRNSRICTRMIRIDLSETAQKRIGDVFGILKAEASERNCDALTAHIEDALVRGVFDSLRKLPKDAPQESVLESSVSKVNDALFRLLGEDGLSLGPETISGAIISQKGRDISMAVWGRPSLLLFHPTPSGQSRIYDLTEDGGRSEPPGHGFSQIISGRMTAHDRFLVSSDDLRNPIGDVNLSPLVLQTTPETAVEAIRKALNGMRSGFPVSLFVSDGSTVPSASVRDVPVPRDQKAKSHPENVRSIERLIATESQTSEIMSPPIMRSMVRKLAGALTAVSGGLSEKIQKWREGRAEMNIAPGIQAGIQDQPLESTDKIPQKTEGERPPLADDTDGGQKDPDGEDRDSGLSNLTEAVNGLSRSGKALLILVLAGLSAINLSGLVIDWHGKRMAAIRDYEAAVRQIEQEIDSADASLIYRDYSRAGEILDRAETMAAALQEGDQRRSETKKRLTAAVGERREMANRIVRLPEPEIIASLNGTDGPVALKRLAESGNRIYAAADDGQIVNVNPTGGLNEASKTDGLPTLFLTDGSRLLAAETDGQLLIVSPDGKTGTGRISWGKETVHPTDAVTWGSRLYVLDSPHNRLLRHQATDSGYGNPQFYLKDGTDVSRGVSIAVDGNLYVLQGDGQVTKIRLGERQDFALSPVEPALTNAKRIRTSESDGNLWLLDTANRRLLAFSKESGELQAQYRHETLAETDDFLVNEAERKILAANGNSVLRFELPE